MRPDSQLFRRDPLGERTRQASTHASPAKVGTHEQLGDLMAEGVSSRIEVRVPRQLTGVARDKVKTAAWRCDVFWFPVGFPRGEQQFTNRVRGGLVEFFDPHGAGQGVDSSLGSSSVSKAASRSTGALATLLAGRSNL